MNLYKELFDFLEANNWLSLEDEENAKGVISSYIKVYKPELKQGQLLPIDSVSEILGYFDYLGDRWHITEIDGEMLNGWRLTPKGKKHTLWIHSDNVTNLVESSR